MAKRMSQKDIKRQINELNIVKRSAMMRAVAAIVGMAALIAVFLTLQAQGFEFANSQFGNLFLFILAVVASGIAGMGTRKWKRAKDKITYLEKNLK